MCCVVVPAQHHAASTHAKLFLHSCFLPADAPSTRLCGCNHSQVSPDSKPEINATLHWCNNCEVCVSVACGQQKGFACALLAAADLLLSERLPAAAESDIQGS